MIRREGEKRKEKNLRSTGKKIYILSSCLNTEREVEFISKGRHDSFHDFFRPSFPSVFACSPPRSHVFPPPSKTLATLGGEVSLFPSSQTGSFVHVARRPGIWIISPLSLFFFSLSLSLSRALIRDRMLEASRGGRRDTIFRPPQSIIVGPPLNGEARNGRREWGDN